MENGQGGGIILCGDHFIARLGETILKLTSYTRIFFHHQDAVVPGR